MQTTCPKCGYQNAQMTTWIDPEDGTWTHDFHCTGCGYTFAEKYDR